MNMVSLRRTRPRSIEWPGATMLTFRCKVFAATMLAAASVAAAQEYPYRPIRIITAEAGGGSDIAARIIGQALVARLGQQIVVDNRGPVAAELAAKSPPTGYTLLLIGSTL